MITFRSFLTVLAMVLWPLQGLADTVWVKLPRADRTSIDALLARPKGAGPFPAILYQHGTLVRERGHRGAAEAGYDLGAILDDFSGLGYMALAPVRQTPAGCCNGDAAVAEGVALSKAGARYLRRRSDADPGKLCLIGYSEGAMVALWSLIEDDDFAAAVVISPATMGGQRARAETRGARRLVRSGRIQAIKEHFAIIVGGSDTTRVRRAVKRYAVQSGARAISFRGDHRSFHKPRKDVDDVVLRTCPR
ncbi:MAG: hypothetical protein QGH73_08155 [Rhodospirillales bacterium]|nr:hypothetical protein [Rhodospirillaceae bacterium]MDP6430144.1 hypothetical protein [Rhodospirillales bacterium]MDP6642839.1 hypothetical protein [Rhodospirillales bacterium]MDP6841637.1 hypothetical protein [Rhodospirillales bacterium]